MSRAKKVIIPILEALQAQSPGKTLHILEIGCVRNEAPAYELADGYSTVHIAEFCKDTPHLFTSVDLYHTDKARKVLDKYGLAPWVHLVKADGLEYMDALRPNTMDLVYIDGGPSADAALGQFIRAYQLVRNDGYVVVDDYYPESKDVVRAQKIAGYLRDIGKLYVVVDNMLIHQINKR